MNISTNGGLNEHSAPRKVILRRKRDGENGDRIVSVLGDYFDVRPADSAVEVSVDARAVGPPALRVAAILDGIDIAWEEYFHLPVRLIQGNAVEEMEAGL